MKSKISIITLAVSDLERSTAFYRDGLGLPTLGDFQEITFFRLNGTWLALYPQDQHTALQPVCQAVIHRPSTSGMVVMHL